MIEEESVLDALVAAARDWYDCCVDCHGEKLRELYKQVGVSRPIGSERWPFMKLHRDVVAKLAAEFAMGRVTSGKKQLEYQRVLDGVRAIQDWRAASGEVYRRLEEGEPELPFTISPRITKESNQH
jgi:hypothetical protein